MAARPSSAKNSGAQDPALPQKKRARRRLVGAAAVCLAAAIVLPIVLDSEPRQIRGDVQVQIPSRDTPLSEPLPGPSRSGVIGVTPRADDAKAADRDAPRSRAEAGPDGAPAGASADAPGVPRDAAPSDPATRDAPAPQASAQDTPPKSAAASDAAGGEAARDGAAREAPAKEAAAKEASAKEASAKEASAKEASAKEASAKEASAKEASAKGAAKPGAKEAKAPVYIWQVGAFASEKGAAEQLERVRKVGLKGYTEKIKTPQGERIRVRVGPFATREAAEQARAKLRGIGIDPAQVAP
jgi:DedD protein